MALLLQIVTNTPLWVWPLLLLVLWLGWLGLSPRIVSVRLGILPLVGLISSLVGLLQPPTPLFAAGSWLVALLAALPVGYMIGGWRPVRALPDGRFEAEGGWFMLIFGVAIFAARYTLGVLFGLFPALKAETLWIMVANGVGGVVAGIGLGWFASLWLRARRAPARA